jgi:hypothetical protein
MATSTEERHGSVQLHMTVTDKGVRVDSYAPSMGQFAQAACKRANADARRMGIKTRYRAVTVYADGFKELIA